MPTTVSLLCCIAEVTITGSARLRRSADLLKYLRSDAASLAADSMAFYPFFKSHLWFIANNYVKTSTSIYFRYVTSESFSNDSNTNYVRLVGLKKSNFGGFGRPYSSLETNTEPTFGIFGSQLLVFGIFRYSEYRRRYRYFKISDIGSVFRYTDPILLWGWAPPHLTASWRHPRWSY